MTGRVQPAYATAMMQNAPSVAIVATDSVFVT